jgi:hypothetical protein
MLHLEGAHLEMLWIVGSILLAVWFVLKFLLHKSGMVHVVLLIAISSFVIQLVQDLRTKAYERSLRR